MSLPYLSHWHTGVTTPGFGPKYQMKLMNAGIPIMPWYIMPVPGTNHSLDYYAESIERAARFQMPIAFVSTQWEKFLSDNEYFNLPVGDNPNVQKLDGTFERTVSAFGRPSQWREVGKKWTAHVVLEQLQKWYRDPPLILFVSNNEHPKLRWYRTNECKEFGCKFGDNVADDLRRKYVGDGFVELYKSLFSGMKENLCDNWAKSVKFIGYNAFVPAFTGRWVKWADYSLHTEDRMTPWTEVWDGASLPYYTNPWDGSTDCNVWSVQTEAMNWTAAKDLLKDDFWLELSIWDGSAPKADNDKRKQYIAAGQTYSPERYMGSAQFGLWLLRPKSVREFRSHNEQLAPYESYFLALATAVKRLYDHPMLGYFYRFGEIVVNPNREHPYQTIVPKFFENVKRWYALETSLTPKEKWKLHTELPVFALAFKLTGEYLVYAHAPMGEKKDVIIQIPGFGDITVPVSVGGDFWRIDSNKVLSKVDVTPLIEKV